MADRISASPQSPVLGALARHLRAARDLGDEARIPLIDMGLGEMFLGKAPEEIEEWSYGNLPFQRGREGIGSRIPQLKRGRAEGVMDTAFGALDAAGLAGLARRGMTRAAGSAGSRFAANPIPQIGAIKPRGGNWVPGGVESSISNLLRREYTPASVDLQRTTLEMARQRGYDDNIIAELARGLQQREASIALNRWIEGPLTKYIKRDFATPEDPIRKLADEGILHMEIPQTQGRTPDYIAENRLEAGFPAEGLSTTPGGSMWENLSDRTISWGPAKYLQREPKMMAENPWMQKLDPESQVYEMRTFIERGTGFDHLVDELSNSLNPDSGLPRNLLLRPEQMQQMGIEKAVRHVDAVNKWRAAQQAAANAELANKAMVVRGYAENNPKGLRWMELKVGDPDENMLSSLSPSDRARYERYLEKGDSPLEAMRASMGDQNPLVKELEKQLKYEGDTMGHCVGGYCPDVLEGRSRIFSLRDARGEPHVTVEVNPAEEWATRPGAVDENPIIKNEWPEFYRDLVRRVNGNPSPEDIATFKDYMLSKYPDDQSVASFFGPAFKIQQIKGKQNLAPKDEYLPFVQDFVRNSPLVGGWSHVGDLQNTGLRKVGDRYVTLDELKDVPRDGLGLPIGYQPLDDLPEWRDGGLVDEGIDDPVQFALKWRDLVDAENGYRRV